MMEIWGIPDENDDWARGWGASSLVVAGLASLVVAVVVAAVMAVFVLASQRDVEFSGWSRTAALVLWSLSTVAAVTALLATARLRLRPRRLQLCGVLAAVSLLLLAAGALVTGAGARPVDQPFPPPEPSEPGGAGGVSESEVSDEPSPDSTTSEAAISEPPPPDGPDQVDLALLAARVLPDLTSSAASILSIAGDAGEAATLLSQVGVEAAKQAAQSAVSETFTTLGDVTRGWLDERLFGAEDSGDLEQRLRDAIRADLEDDVAELVEQAGDEGLDELQRELDAYVDRLVAELKVELEADRAVPTREPGAVRVGGADRYETAARLAEDAYPSGSRVVYVATGERFPDALAAARASEVFGAPLLLVTRTTVPCVTLEAIAKLSPQTIVIVGGEQAVGVRVAEDLDRALEEGLHFESCAR